MFAQTTTRKAILATARYLPPTKTPQFLQPPVQLQYRTKFSPLAQGGSKTPFWQRLLEKRRLKQKKSTDRFIQRLANEDRHYVSPDETKLMELNSSFSYYGEHHKSLTPETRLPLNYLDDFPKY